MATQTKAKPAAKKAPTRKAPAKKAEPEAPSLTAIDDGVTIKVDDGHAEVNIKGRFDLDGLIAVCKRVDRARAELS